ncbi:MAG: protoheme IX farnesyltransferase [Myxococcales bacterium]|nr:protoheme IX farnesyltransferase [Myxococcales bacterium]
MWLADVASLTKPRLSSLVLATALGGMYLAPGAVSLARALLTLLAIAGTVAAANALNCYLERDVDRLMERTMNRPLPAGRLEPKVALWLGLGLAAGSLPALALEANLLTALLGLAALLLYVAAYTPLKRRSHLAMVVGAVPGALPPLMGWTAATGSVEVPGLALFAVLFLWQLPHFTAIALFRKREYQRAGLMSLPLERGDGAARALIGVSSALLFPVTLLPYALGLAGEGYLGAASLLGAAFLLLIAFGWRRELGSRWARAVFLSSVFYLAGLFAALGLDAREPAAGEGILAATPAGPGSGAGR